MIEGRVVNVETRLAGTQLVGTHTAPLSVLQVVDVAGLLDVGSVKIGLDVLAYTDVDTADPDGTSTADTVTLAAPTENDYAAGALVLADPPREYKVAFVEVVSPATGDSQVVEALVKPKIQDSLDEGPRQSGLGETVRLVQVPGQMMPLLDEVTGIRKRSNAGYLNDGTLPPDAVDVPAWVADGKPVSLLDADAAHHPDLTITGGHIETSAVGSGFQRWSSGPDAAEFLDVDGQPLVSFSTAPGSRPHWTGRGDFDSFAGETGAFTQQVDVTAGAVLALKTSTQLPVTPPVTTTFYDFISVPDVDFNQIGGLVHDGTDFWLLYYRLSDKTTWLCRVDVTAGVGTLDYTWEVPSSWGWSGQAIAFVAGTFYVLIDDGPEYSIAPVDASTGVIGTPYSFTRRAPSGPKIDTALGEDGTHLLVAEPTADFIKVTTIAATTGITLSTVSLPPVPTDGRRSLVGVQRGSMDFGSTRFVVWPYSDPHRKVLVAEADLSDWDDVLNFRYANNENPIASCWAPGLDGGRFASVGAASNGIWLHGHQPPDGEGIPVYVTTSLRNATHGYDTPVGSYATIQGHQRAGIRVNAGTVPGGGGPADPEFYQAWYTTHDITTVAPADWSYLGDCDATTGDLAVADLTFSFEGSPAANTFPTGDPAALQSADGTDLIRADKTGLVFDLIAAGGGGGYSDDDVFFAANGDIIATAKGGP
jgi:hypothetical protein